jgi:hypothetical protein
MTFTASRILLLIAVVCFAIAVLVGQGAVSLGRVDWTDGGLFFFAPSFLA